MDTHSLYPQARNSAVADAMSVVQGTSTGYVLLKPEPFDVAAAGLIIQQAGGMVTDDMGNPWHPFCGSFVSSNGLLHSELLKKIPKLL